MSGIHLSRASTRRAARAPCAALPGPAWWAALAALLLSLAGCSVISVKTPEKPLSTKDLNARILTHEFAERFITAVEQTADTISVASTDPTVRQNALRWKIAAAGSSLRAAGQVAPMLSLLDTWALTVQMHEYLTAGAGQSLFGAEQGRAVTLSRDLAEEAEDLTRHITDAREFEADQQFVRDYARAHPIESLSFARASFVDLWAQHTGGKDRLVDALGTVPEAMAQTGELVRMYGDAASSQALWRAELAAQEAGISGEEVQTALRRLDERFARFSAMAEKTPDLVNGVMRDVRTRMDISWADMMNTIRTERAALAATVSAEREAATNALDAERAAVTVDAARISSQIISDAGREARQLVREALALAIVLAIVVLGLPFAAGYLVGRAHRRT